MVADCSACTVMMSLPALAKSATRAPGSTIILRGGRGPARGLSATWRMTTAAPTWATGSSGAHWCLQRSKQGPSHAAARSLRVSKQRRRAPRAAREGRAQVRVQDRIRQGPDGVHN